MDKFSYNSYPDSAESSPRSRDVDFENPSPWEENQQQPTNSYKVKFMCSYGGKIQPRPHDNHLTYVHGETKIMSVDRGIRFPVLLSKLSGICGGDGGDVSFKYQLPGEDLDALISVTNDDDLEHMMHEYDRLLRMSSKPARMRLFLFSSSPVSGGFGSEGSIKSDRFVEAMNPIPSRPESEKSVTAPPNNADFLFGSEKIIAPPSPSAVKVPQPMPDPVVLEPQIYGEQRVISPEHGMNPAEIQRQIHEFQMMQIRDQEQQQQQHSQQQQQHSQQQQQHSQQQQHQHQMQQEQQQQHQMQQQQQEAMYRRKSEDGLMETGRYYSPAYAQNQPPTTVSQTNPQAPMGYWQGNNNVQSSMYTTTTSPGLPEQPVYMIQSQSPAPGTLYHAAPHTVMRPMATTTQGSQGYYPPVQRMHPDAYREQQQPTYNVIQPPQQQPPIGTPIPPTQSFTSPYSAGPQVMVSGSMGLSDTTQYTQMAYDAGTGKHVYYTVSGEGMVQPSQPQYQGIGHQPISGMTDLRTGPDGKIAINMAPKVSQNSDSV